MKSVKSSASKSSTFKRSSAKKAPARWWEEGLDVNATMSAVKALNNKMSKLPSDVGVLQMFESDFGVKMNGAVLMSGVDENNKLCISLSDAQYDFLKNVEEQLQSTLIAKVKMCDPKFESAEFTPSVKISESTGQKYMKTKVQLLGRSVSFGANMEGKSFSNPAEGLMEVGSVLNIRIRVDGVYVTKERAGLVTKVDIYKVVSVPSEEEKEQARDARLARMEAERCEELKNF